MLKRIVEVKGGRRERVEGKGRVRDAKELEGWRRGDIQKTGKSEQGARLTIVQAQDRHESWP